MTYRGRCLDCAYEWDYEQSMKEAKLPPCPECRGPSQRVIHPAGGFVLQGHGWPGRDGKDK